MQQQNSLYTHIETDAGFGTFEQQITFLNLQDCKIKIVPVENSQNKSPSLHLTIFSENPELESLKYTRIIDINEECEKQKNFDLVFQDLELNLVGTNFAQYFSQNQYKFEQDQQNENLVKLQINSSMMIGTRQKEISFEFSLSKTNQEVAENQSLETIVQNLQKNIVQEQKKNKQFQEQIQKQNIQTQQMMQQIQQLVLKNMETQNKKIQDLNNKITDFQLETHSNFKKAKENETEYSQQIQIIIKLQEYLQQSYENCLLAGNNSQQTKVLQEQLEKQKQQTAQFEQQLKLQQQNQNFMQQQQQQQQFQQNIPFNMNNNDINSNIQVQSQSTPGIEDFLSSKPKSIYQVQQFVKSLNNNTYDFLEECYKKIFGQSQSYLYIKRRLQGCIETLDPKQILTLSLMIPKKFQDWLNPRQILKSNIKNITAQQFKEKCQNRSNCIIIVKLKMSSNSDWEIYCGYSPDSFIFGKDSKKTEQNDERCFPFIFDFNLHTKRTFTDVKYNAYNSNSSNYFSFGELDFSINEYKSFFYANKDYVYKSLDQEENKCQKSYYNKHPDIIEIEVISLF